MEFYAGDTVQITFTVTDAGGSPKDLTGASAEFGIGYPGVPRLELESPDAAIVWSDPAAGELKVNLSKSETRALAPGRRSFVGTYQLRITDGAGVGTTVVVGDVTCKASIV